MTSRPALILASGSPRRKELLRQIGLEFTVIPTDLDERIMPGESPETFAVRVAGDKARAAAGSVGEGFIIAADTIVVAGGEILGKPADAADAVRMLALLSGRQHRVLTGLAVMDAATRRLETRLASTRVWFRSLRQRDIDEYVAGGEPLDKAGAYGIQGKGALLIERIEGCYFNVVGLPLAVLGELLDGFGVDPW